MHKTRHTWYADHIYYSPYYNVKQCNAYKRWMQVWCTFPLTGLSSCEQHLLYELLITLFDMLHHVSGTNFPLHCINLIPLLTLLFFSTSVISTACVPSLSSSITPSLFHSQLKTSFSQIIPATDSFLFPQNRLYSFLSASSTSEIFVFEFLVIFFSYGTVQ